MKQKKKIIEATLKTLQIIEYNQLLLIAKNAEVSEFTLFRKTMF